MYEEIKKDIIDSMKSHDTLKLQTLRGVKGAVDLYHINQKVEITDEVVLDILTKETKTRRESILEFEKGNRDDLIEKTNKEIEILTKYLPKQLTTEELNEVIDEVFKKVGPTSNKDMGQIMRELTPLVKGKCDMKQVSLIIKDKLSDL